MSDHGNSCFIRGRLLCTAVCMLLAGAFAVAGCGDDTAGGCSEGEVECGGECVDLQSDAENCGQCGSACEVANGTPGCSAGSCSIASCITPYDDCDGSYGNGCEADTRSDSANCGGCDNACTGGLACDEGSCSDTCTGGRTNCDGTCVDTGIDTSNCGDCGNVCSVANGTPECSEGSCTVASCTAPYDDCDGDYASGCEANLDTDPANCGDCGNACTGGQACDVGSCSDACSGDLTNCDGSCVDTGTDRENCGDCGNACTVANGTPECSAGSCAIGSCTAPYDDCDGSYGNGCETNTGTDTSSCGECTSVCAVANGNPACTAGSCSIDSCTYPYDDCDGDYENGCETNLDTAPATCGDCGNACTGGQVCDGATCRNNCTGGRTDCNGSCVDTDTDPANCGDCDVTCSVANGTPGCSAGSCTIDSCYAPFADCDDSYDSGCETDTSDDPDNCGDCGNACTTTTRICAASQCLAGSVCIHTGEMDEPGSYGPGSAYATICQDCALGDFSSCSWFSVCEYTAPSCGGCVSGLADGTYQVAVFIDNNNNFDSGDPRADSGDAVADSCTEVTITDGGMVPIWVTITAEDIVP